MYNSVWKMNSTLEVHWFFRLQQLLLMNEQTVGPTEDYAANGQ